MQKAYLPETLFQGMFALESRVYSTESLMVGHGLLRERDEDDRGLGCCGGRNAADDDLLAELSRLQALGGLFLHDCGTYVGDSVTCPCIC